MGSFFGAFILLLAAGVPIALTLGVSGMAYLYFTGNGALLLAFPQRMMAGVDQFILLTIPLFLLAGMLMNVGGITDRIVVFARTLVGHRKGGMSSVTVLSAGFFAGISGSATAEAAALGSILIPAMKKQGIPPSYAAALIAVSSIMGSIIPPSIKPRSPCQPPSSVMVAMSRNRGFSHASCSSSDRKVASSALRLL